MSDKTHLLVQFESGDGSGELNVGADHELVAHLDGALNDGGRTGRWTYLTFTKPGSDTRQVLGTLVASRGHRILFFPAYDIQAQMDDGTADSVHHITLDPRRDNGRRSSHISLKRHADGEKGSRGLNHQVGTGDDGLDYWFTISVPLDETHTDLPAVLRYPVSLPSRGLVNRVEALAGERIKTIKVGLPPKDQDTSEVIQFDVWVGESNPSAVNTQPMGFRFKETDPVDKSIRPAGRTDFDFGGKPPWVRVVSTWSPKQFEGARVSRSRLNDGFAELLT